MDELCERLAREADALARDAREASRYVLEAAARVGHCVDSRCEGGWTVRLAEDDSLELVRCDLHGGA